MTAPPAVDERPLVVACLRITDLRPDVDPLTGAVTRDLWGTGLSAADGSALEHALRVAEAWSGRALALAVGPSTIEPVLREVLALGAEVLRIPDEQGVTEHGYAEELAGSEQGLARTIADAIQLFGTPALVLCGDRSADRGTGALPAFLAHELRAAQALGLVRLEAGRPSDGAAPTLIGERRLDGGWRERLLVPVPAVCSVEGAGIRLRRASLTGTLQAEAATITTHKTNPRTDPGPADGSGSTRVGSFRVFVPRTRVLPAPESDDPRIRLLALTGALTAHDPPTLIGPVGAPEAADHLIGFLVRHGYLEQPPVSDRAGQEASL